MSIVGLLLGLSSCQSVLAENSLFPGSLFPEDKKTPLFPKFNTEESSISSTRPKSSAPDTRALQDTIARDDDLMRNQMQKVAGWLQEFSLRNQNRFPGTYGSSGTIERAAEVQLTELVGANPYSNVSTNVSAGGLDNLAPGLPYYYSDGSPAEGSPMSNDEWTAEVAADNVHRIKLQQDGSASVAEVDNMRKFPPTSMQADPGTIWASGNGQGFIYVWGAGIDGKPIKDPGGRQPYIITARTGTTVEDQGVEAGY